MSDFILYTEADLAHWREVGINKDLVGWLELARDELHEEAVGYTERGSYNQAHQAIGGARALQAVLVSLKRKDALPVVNEDDDEFHDPAMPEGEIRKARNAKKVVATD